MRKIQYQKDSTVVNYNMFGSDNVNVNVVQEIGARKPKTYKADSKLPTVNVSSMKPEINAAKNADITRIYLRTTSSNQEIYGVPAVE